jgi:uncharacterized protein (DUF4415 family)
LLADSRWLLKHTNDVHRFPDEDSKLIREARALWQQLHDLIQKPYSVSTLEYTYDRLQATYEQVQHERQRRIGHDLLVDELIESDVMDEFRSQLDGLQGRLPQAQLNQMFQECLDAALRRE